MMVCQPIFATTNPLRVAEVRDVLLVAGFPAPKVVAPEGLTLELEESGGCLAILDGHTLPHRESLAQMCRLYSQARFVVWAARPTADLLRIALECAVHGVLSSGLPRDEAAAALVRIRAGERVLRFDPDAGPLASSKPVYFSAREQHLLRELAGGANNARIAAALQTSPSAVKGSLSRLFQKTGARNRKELAQLCQSFVLAGEPRRDPPVQQEPDSLWMLESL
jgi:DNA-binding NarL/FixJ family response regulator